MEKARGADLVEEFDHDELLGMTASSLIDTTQGCCVFDYTLKYRVEVKSLRTMLVSQRRGKKAVHFEIGRNDVSNVVHGCEIKKAGQNRSAIGKTD